MKILKKILLLLFIMVVGFGVQGRANANEQEALAFFHNYVNSANSYSSSLLGMYSPNARIIRQVIKPNGQLANATFSMRDYKHQMILSSKIARIRHYKNYYSNISVTKDSSGYKIVSYRTPSTGGGRLKTIMVVEKIGGKWQITEELMQTREQILLKYAK